MYDIKAVIPPKPVPPSGSIPGFRKALHGWISRTLPTVFTEEMTVIENVYKLRWLYNNLVNDTNELKKLMNEYIQYIDDSFDQFYNWFSSLDVQEEINNYLKMLVDNGTLSLILQKLVYNPINVKYAGIEPDTGEDLTEKLQSLFDSNPNSKFYFPSGIYNINGTINANSGLDLELESDAILQSVANNDYMFRFYFKNDISIKGGQFQKGNESDISSRKLTGTTGNTGIFRFGGCNRIRIERSTFNYCSCADMCYFIASSDVTIESCNFNNSLYGMCMFMDTMLNVYVRSCKFTNCLVSSSTSPYAYTCASGSSTYSQPTGMIKNYYFENNSVDNAEWEGFDCHGGQNVYVLNNTFHNCNRFITCYGDDRPDHSGEEYSNTVIMNNILINDDDYISSSNEFSISVRCYINTPNRNIRIENIKIINPVNDSNTNFGIIRMIYNENVILRNIDIIENRENSHIYTRAIYLLSCLNVAMDNVNVKNVKCSSAPFKFYNSTGEYGVIRFQNYPGNIPPYIVDVSGAVSKIIWGQAQGDFSNLEINGIAYNIVSKPQMYIETSTLNPTGRWYTNQKPRFWEELTYSVSTVALSNIITKSSSESLLTNEMVIPGQEIRIIGGLTNGDLDTTVVYRNNDKIYVSDIIQTTGNTSMIILQRTISPQN